MDIKLSSNSNLTCTFQKFERHLNSPDLQLQTRYKSSKITYQLQKHEQLNLTHLIPNSTQITTY